MFYTWKKFLARGGADGAMVYAARLGVVAVVMVLSVGAAGCLDDESGIDRNRQLTSLSQPEVETLCEWGIDYLGGDGGMQYCPAEGSVVTLEADLVQCVEVVLERYDMCNATVGQFEDCFHEIADNPCDTIECIFDDRNAAICSLTFVTN